MESVHVCDKCGEPVDPRNDAVILSMIAGEILEITALLTPPRHLLPTEKCEGSPSRAQYLEGQPRDPRGIYTYDPAYEEPFRRAYAKMTTVEEE